MMRLNRRRFALGCAAVAATGSVALTGIGGAKPAAAADSFEVTHSDGEWQRLLTPAQYEVLRKHKTERAGSSPLDHENHAGTFHCAGCELALFSSTTKFDSGTGWPSFWKPLDGAIGTSRETFLFMAQTEVHCRRCGGHLGHVFEDGPKPTGLRYCMNGVALAFTPTATGA
jgi:peptide-methionine (R)-S-oxide reductase